MVDAQQRQVASHGQPLGQRLAPVSYTHLDVYKRQPHHGAPLERGGNWLNVMLDGSPYAAPFSRLGKGRSAGITDLRYGSLVDADWHGRDRFAHGGDERVIVPLPVGVRCYAVAGSLSADGAIRESRATGGACLLYTSRCV